MADQPDFQYFIEKLAYEESLDIQFLSLNEKSRKDFREQDRKNRLAIENKLRIAKGEEPLKSFDEEDDEEEDIEDSEEPRNKIDTDDAFLQESANVLLDLIRKEKRLKAAIR